MKELNKFRQFLNEGKKETNEIFGMGANKEDMKVAKALSALEDALFELNFLGVIDDNDYNNFWMDKYGELYMDVMGQLDPAVQKKYGYEGYDEEEELNEGTWSLGGPKEIDSIISGLQGLIKMADNAQNKKNAAGRGFVNALQNQLQSEGWTSRLYKTMGDDTFFDHYDAANTAAAVRDFDGVKNHLGDAIARAEELKATIMKNSGLEENDKDFETALPGEEGYDSTKLALSQAGIPESKLAKNDSVLDGILKEEEINERRAIPIANRKISLSSMNLKPLQQVLNDKEMDKFENIGIVYDVMGKGSKNKSGRLVKVEYGEEDERGRPKLQTKMVNGEDTKGVVGLLMIPKGKLGDVINTLKTEYDTQIKVLQSKLDALNNVK